MRNKASVYVNGRNRDDIMTLLVMVSNVLSYAVNLLFHYLSNLGQNHGKETLVLQTASSQRLSLHHSGLRRLLSFPSHRCFYLRTLLGSKRSVKEPHN